jgi:PAS domain S-box-containing protein
MLKQFMTSKIAFVGGGVACMTMLEFLLSNEFFENRPQILGVADHHSDAPGIRYAKVMGIFTTHDYRQLYDLPGLDAIVEITRNPFLAEAIRKTLPPHIRLFDQFEVRSLWDALLIEEVRRKSIKTLEECNQQPPLVEALVHELCDRFLQIICRRNDRSREIETELAAHERAQAQIIQGSTIPTFVVNKDHVITHWNKAMEKLTGYRGGEMVGTRRQWEPFYDHPRPALVDVILDQIHDPRQIERLYGNQWQSSPLIEGAYEAEGFFPRLGPEGKWCWFTAAPIRAADGTIVAAIETLWDKTEEKKANEQRDRQNRMMAETARELAKSEQILAQIVHGSTIPTFVINERHLVTHWNRAAEKLTGFSGAEMVGTNRQWVPFYAAPRRTMADVIVDQIDETEIPKLYVKWRKSALIEDAYEAEGFFPHLGRSGKWIWFTAAPIHSPDGAIIGAIETLWDTTEDKKAEQERERHTQELGTLVAVYTALSAPRPVKDRLETALQEVKNYLGAEDICLFLLGQDGRFEFSAGEGIAAPLCRQQIGQDRDNSLIYQVVRRGRFALYGDLPAGEGAEFRVLEAAGIRSLIYIPFSTKESRRFGMIRIASRKVDAFSPRDQNILELIGNRIGVAIENALLQESSVRSEEKYRSLFNNDPNPLFILDGKTFQILDTNARAQNRYGYGQREFAQKSFLDLGDAEDEEVRKGLDRLAPNQSALFTKKRHFDSAGGFFYVNINVSWASYLESNVLIASTTDITETVEKEVQLIQASKMTTLGTMAAGMAHELNQPLNVIQVCADYLNKMTSRGLAIGREEMQSLVRDISGNVQRAAGIIKHMRDFSRQSEVVTTRICINDPIQDVFKVLGHQLKMHQIEVNLALDPDIAPILAEHNRLEQVFINLVTNAMDAMDEKASRPGQSVAVKKLEIRSTMENGHVVVKVSDTGIGMAPELIDKIFEPFFTTKKVGKGTGLGVSISYGIVKDYGGTIRVTSAIGQGTTFELRFPPAEG